MVAIVGILAALAASVFTRLQPKDQLRAATKDLLSTLRQARTIAVTGSAPTNSFPYLVERVHVIFAPGIGEYRVQLETRDPAAPGAPAPFFLVYKVVRLPDYVGATMDLALNTPLPGNELIFERNGGTNAFGDITIQESRTNDTRRINVTRAGSSRVTD